MNREIFQGSEVAFIKSPAQNELTRSARILYSEGSNSVETARAKPQGRTIFMAEDQSEKTPGAPSLPRPGKSPEGVKRPGPFSHPEAEKDQMATLGEFLRRLAEKNDKSPEEFARPIAEELEELPEGERQRAAEITRGPKEKRLADIDVEARLGGGGEEPPVRGRAGEEEEAPAISLESFTDEKIRKRLQIINAMPKRLRDDIEVLRGEMAKISEMEGEVPEEEMVRANSFIDRLLVKRENEILEQQMSARARQAQERHFDAGARELIRNNAKERERMFEKLFERADSTPGREFHDAFSVFYDEPVYREFIDVLREGGPALAPEVTRYVHLRELREVLHNANYVLVAQMPAETLISHAQHFRSELADMAYRTPGVTVAAHMYEQALEKVKDENKGWLPYSQVAWNPKTGGGESKVEQLTRKLFDKAITDGLVKDREGNAVTSMADWEKNRAIALARGMGILTMRTIEIAALSKLPPTQYASLYAQDILRDMNPFSHLIGKFGIGAERLAVFGFLLNRGNQPWSPWSQKELLDFMKATHEPDGLPRAIEKRDRFIGMLNPYKAGSIFSRSGWRFGDKGDSFIGDIEGERRKWIGTGVQLEKARDNLSSKDREKSAQAEMQVRGILNKMAKITPLKLYYNLGELKEAVDQDLGLTPEQKSQAIDDLAVLQEKAVQEGMAEADRVEKAKEEASKRGEEIEIKPRGIELHFESIEDAERREATRKLATAIKTKFEVNGKDSIREKFILTLAKNPDTVPFVFGTEDVPFDQYDFINPGGTNIPRKFRDYKAENAAVTDTVKILRKMAAYKKPEEIVEDLHAAYENISMYNEDAAREFTLRMAEGIMKFYAKDWWARLPLGIGWGTGFLAAHNVFNLPIINRIPVLKELKDRRSSYAKTVFGNYAMGWDEGNKWNFTRLLEDQGMLTQEQMKMLRERTGSTKWLMIWDKVRSYGPLGFLAFLAELVRYSAKDVYKEYR